ncbi:hypothetical protein LINGRAHAP2_LOCUS29381, partial [Linum grandiflorum]
RGPPATSKLVGTSVFDTETSRIDYRRSRVLSTTVSGLETFQNAAETPANPPPRKSLSVATSIFLPRRSFLPSPSAELPRHTTNAGDPSFLPSSPRLPLLDSFSFVKTGGGRCLPSSQDAAAAPFI